MKKICFTLMLLLCCGSTFAFDPVAGDITIGFSRDNRLEVVKDDIYKLMWQDGNLLPSRIYHDEAVHYCENLNFAGFDDWRLPTVNELLSITDDTRFKTAINLAFKNAELYSNSCWSSTKKAGNPSDVWCVSFNDGMELQCGVSNKFFVRCVRQY